MKTTAFILANFIWLHIYCLLNASPDSSRRQQKIDTRYKYNLTERTTRVRSVPVSTERSMRTKYKEIQKSDQYRRIDTTTEDSTINDTTDFSILSDQFRSCPQLAIEKSGFEKSKNESVYVPRFNILLDKANYVILKSKLYICSEIVKNHTKPAEEPPQTLSITFVCTCISAVFIIFHILMFIFLENLRNLPGYCLLSLSVTLLIAYLCLFLKYEVNDDESCTVVGILLLYFFLASFFWMNIIAYDVWLSIKLATDKLRSTADRKIAARFTVYSLYAWGSPFAIVIPSIIVHNTARDSKYSLVFEIGNCWFQHEEAFTVYFLIPLSIILFANLLFLSSSCFMISKVKTELECRSDLISRLILSFKLGSAIGLMWIFGFLAKATGSEWLWYLYDICTALQGVSIFFSFIMNKKSRKAFIKKVLRK